MDYAQVRTYDYLKKIQKTIQTYLEKSKIKTITKCTVIVNRDFKEY